jgi:hypothetical protein
MSSEANNVVDFKVAPKRMERHYKKQKYILIYLPQEKLWEWRVTWVTENTFSDKAKNLNAAQKAAEKHIDTTLKLRGQ